MTTTADLPRRGRRLGIGAVVVIVLVALAATVAIGLLRAPGEPELVPEPMASTAPAVESGALYVHVSGAVLAPGLYRLEPGARVFDALSAAGGLIEQADSGAVNLARPVEDGEQVHVPLVGEAPAATGPRADGRIDLNTADAAALDELPRIGPAISERIVQWREAHGRFTSVDDLLSVPGIGDKLLAGIRDLVTV